MFDVFFKKANELNAKGQPFAMAIVVRHETPISGKPGDKAIIQADGSIFGWIGGGCTQPVIVQEAKKALKDGKPRLVRIAPESTVTQNGVEEYTMTCHSGGTVDIYIEPVMPKPQLVILGKSVVAQTLARLGRVLDYRVVAIAPDADAPLFPDVSALHTELDLSRLHLTTQTYVVVSTQGERDEAALAEVLKHDLPYVAFVASRKKAEQVFQYLTDHGTPEERLAQIKVPAGLDIKARTSEEIAVSILAEIIHVMRSATPAEPPAVLAPTRHAETLRIGEMSCQHCVHTVQTALEAIAGVAVHEVEIGSAAISYDPSAVDRPQIVEAIEKRGYTLLSEA
jgi:xanthine dehydrogenase accessory factor